MRKLQPVFNLLMGIITAVLVAPPSNSAVYDRRTPIVDAVEKILPNVVNISTSKVVSINRSPFPRSFRSPFDDLFSDMFRQDYRLEGLGSGVLVDGGYVITNHHVISYEQYKVGPADDIYVNFYDDKEPREAILVGANPDADVAILKLKGDAPEHYLTWGRSDDLMIGETVIAAGSALGQPFTVTAGIISALNRTMDVQNGRQYSNLIQTNADINQGNSGGPLVNINGEFIGLNTMILSPSGGSVGLGFAIPASRIKIIFDYWINHIISVEDQLGIKILNLEPRHIHWFKNYFDSLRDLELNGVFINAVSLTGIAADYLKPYDIILEVNGKGIKDSSDFHNRLEEHQGNELELKIVRKGDIFPVRMRTLSRTVEMENWQGMTLQELDNPWRNWFEIPDNFEGLVVTAIEPGSEAEKEKIMRGDVLVNLEGGHDLHSLEDLHGANRELKNKSKILLQIYRLKDKSWQPLRVSLKNRGSI